MLIARFVVVSSFLQVVSSFFHGSGLNFFHGKVASVRATMKPVEPAPLVTNPKKKWTKIFDGALQKKPVVPRNSFVLTKHQPTAQWRGQGIITFEDGSKYEGWWMNGMRQGQGREESAFGHVVEGEFRSDLPFNAVGEKLVDNGTAVFKGTWINGTRNGPGKLFYPDLNRSLEGEFRGDSICNGKGFLRLSDNSTLEGEFVNRTLTGQGKVTNRWGTVFEGNFDRGQLHGYGKETHLSGITVEGYFNHWDRVNGTQRFADGTTYIGTFHKHTFHGFGTITYANGESYMGEWANGQRHGHGKFSFLNNATYEGEWQHNKAEGNGTYIGHDYFYTGNHVKDLKTGYGVIRYPNGDRYEGMCFNGTRHGQGKRTSVEGLVCEGEFHMGRLHNGQGICVDKTGVRYEGTWYNGKNEGHTKRIDPDGGVFVGEYKRGKANGPGKMVYVDGSVYEGEWQGGLRHGIGKLVSRSGDVQEGRFRLDNFVPEA